MVVLALLSHKLIRVVLRHLGVGVSVSQVLSIGKEIAVQVHPRLSFVSLKCWLKHAVCDYLIRIVARISECGFRRVLLSQAIQKCVASIYGLTSS